MIETTVRIVRTCDKYNVSAEINQARAKNIRALIVIKADRRASLRRHAGCDAIDAGKQSRTIPDHYRSGNG